LSRPLPGRIRRGLCLVIAAPSGAGKSSITRALLDSEPDLTLSVSVTTRAPRVGELEGVHYLFRDQAAFDGMAERDELLEWARVFGRSYGTPRAPVEQALASGHDVVFDIDWQGHHQLKAALPDDVVGVFVLPPSLEVLEQRLARRGDDAQEIARRMHAARAEIAHWAEFDHALVNTDLCESIELVRTILHAARLATTRQPALAELVRKLTTSQF
jgi:guanylate kinase